MMQQKQCVSCAAQSACIGLENLQWASEWRACLASNDNIVRVHVPASRSRRAASSIEVRPAALASTP